MSTKTIATEQTKFVRTRKGTVKDVSTMLAVLAAERGLDIDEATMRSRLNVLAATCEHTGYFNCASGMLEWLLAPKQRIHAKK